jgi:PKD repeat protein
MKKAILILSFFSMALIPTIKAQDFNCGHTYYEQSLFEIDPEAIIRNQEFLRWRDSLLLIKMQEKSTYPKITIPIVFHIIHEYGTENISDAQILDALAIMNRDFQKLNSDTNLVVSAFSNLIGNTNIEFKLPTKDPQGNCTNGIVRYPSFKTNNADDQSKIVAWPRDKYLNIWVVKTIGSQGVAGYAYKPASASSPFFALIDGILILHDYVGSIGTGSPGRSRALTHEVGHSLSLDHPWGATNNPGVACGDDGIPDTPITRGWTNCNNLNGSVCNPPIIENIQNFMEYAYCSRMFTLGQSYAMRVALENSASDRDKLWQSSNLSFTGVDVTSPPTCAPVADFSSNRRFVCVGDAVTFTDRSWRGLPSSYNWEFDDGSPSTASTATATVTFNTPGWKTIKLTVQNAAGSDVIVKKHIYVRDNSTAAFTDLWESFEDTQSDYHWWTFDSPITDASKFEIVSGAGFTGNRSIRINSFDPPQFSPPFSSNKKSERDYFITPPVNLSTTSGNRIAFRFSCATQATQIANMNDVLNVHASKDCGKTWIFLGKIEKVDLITAGQSSTFFTPTNSSQWRLRSFNIPAVAISNNTIFRFEYINGGQSNNLYIDDIHVAVGASIDEMYADEMINLYPNPASNYSNFTIEAENLMIQFVKIVDLTGKEVMMIDAVNANKTIIDSGNFNKGMYLAFIQTEKGIVKKKLIIH